MFMRRAIQQRQSVGSGPAPLTVVGVPTQAAEIGMFGSSSGYPSVRARRVLGRWSTCDRTIRS